MRCFSRSYRSTFRCQKAWTEETSIWKERAVGLSVSGGCSAMRCELSLPERTYNLCLGLCERERERSRAADVRSKHRQHHCSSLLRLSQPGRNTVTDPCFYFYTVQKRENFSSLITTIYLRIFSLIETYLLVWMMHFGARVTWVMCYKTNIIEVIIIVIMILIISPKSDQWDGACNEPIIINHAV